MKTAVLTFVLVALAFTARLPAAETLIDLDVAAGSFSTWKVSAVKARGMMFDFTFVRPREHEKWPPSYKFQLYEEKSGRSLVLQGLYFKDSDELKVSLTLTDEYGNRTQEPDSLFVFPFKLERTVKASWGPERVSLCVDGRCEDYAFALQPDVVSLSCSTGEIFAKRIRFLY